MIILGIDLGKARTGVAVCDRAEMLASPLCVIHERSKELLWACRKIWMAQKGKAPKMPGSLALS